MGISFATYLIRASYKYLDKLFSHVQIYFVLYNVKMKIFVLLLVCATSAFAEDSRIDWSSARPIQEYSWFWDNKPAFMRPTEEMLNRRRARIVNGNIAEYDLKF